jgi:hypothetical protein
MSPMQVMLCYAVPPRILHFRELGGPDEGNFRRARDYLRRLRRRRYWIAPRGTSYPEVAARYADLVEVAAVLALPRPPWPMGQVASSAG